MGMEIGMTWIVDSLGFNKRGKVHSEFLECTGENLSAVAFGDADNLRDLTVREILEISQLDNISRFGFQLLDGSPDNVLMISPVSDFDRGDVRGELRWSFE
jgi:hypothetical protein